MIIIIILIVIINDKRDKKDTDLLINVNGNTRCANECNVENVVFASGRRRMKRKAWREEEAKDEKGKR